MTEKVRFSPSICVTHSCNLNCIYCYQKHDNSSRMDFETAKKILDYIFDNVPEGMEGIEINIIGGEPLLEFDLIKQMLSYAESVPRKHPYLFYATTNGTLLTEEMKDWFIKNRKHFWLGLSLDGAKETHDYNRSNSFDKIDIDFFKKNWPNQSVKMTLSDFSLKNLAKDIKFIHSLGFPIRGVNEFEGDFNWDKDEYLKTLIPQLKELSEFYIENDDIELDQLLGMNLHLCELIPKARRKWCGIGDGAPFFDFDGTQYPCNYITPMSFSKDEIEELQKIDYKNVDNFMDEECIENCYIYPICPTCAGACFLSNKTFKKRTKSRCRTQKLVTLFAAEIQAKRILKNPDKYDETVKYHTIYAIKKIKELYLDEFKSFFPNEKS